MRMGLGGLGEVPGEEVACCVAAEEDRVVRGKGQCCDWAALRGYKLAVNTGVGDL